jgi:hypothetical protein
MTSFNQHDVVGYQAFNNAVSGMLSTELVEYVEFAKRHNSRPFKLIIIGLDFFSSNANFRGFGNRETHSIFTSAESPWYKIKYLMTWDALRYSIRNIRLSFTELGSKPYYDRHNIVTVPVVSKSIHDASVLRDLATFQNDFYGKSYQYRDLRRTFRELTVQNPDSRFIVFVTPESALFWKMMLKDGLLDSYLQWVTAIVDEFGSVYTFMGINDLTTNPDNFIDAHHVYPHVSKQILSRILNQPGTLQTNTGIVINRDTIESYCKKMYDTYGR